MRRGSLLLIVLVLAAACAAPAAEPRPVASSVPVPTTLLDDGAVPWADLKITSDDLNGPPPAPRTPAPGSRPCRADQLSGVLSSWVRPTGTGEEHGRDAAIGKLIGEVDVTNVSTSDCTLQGEVPTTMLAGGSPVPMLYAHNINEEARNRVVAMPPGGHASLRLDWSGPFCQAIGGPLELAIELPNGGGTLRAPVNAEDDPGCQRGEGVNSAARATLSASGFTEPRVVSERPVSPLSQLTVTVTGPATAAAGSQVSFRVALANPTGTPLALDPCPGYLLERFLLGDATIDAVNTSQLYRLNCLPINQVPAGGAVLFEMVAAVPDLRYVGRELTVTWKLFLPQYAQNGDQWGKFTTTIT